jgi:FADH2 O2-dependent halogenase
MYKDNYRYKDDWSLDKVIGGPNKHYRYYSDAGTVHHCFHGGWIWVIPFGTFIWNILWLIIMTFSTENNTVSIGIVLNLDIYPYNHNMTKEEEWDFILNKFPTVKKHLGDLEPIRPLHR